MRRFAWIFAVGLVGICAASAQADRSFPQRASITAVDTTVGDVAAGVAWSPGACEGVVLWIPPLFARYRLSVPGPCPQTSTGRGIAAVSVAPDRVVFLSYVGGNTREWRLWTATPTSRRPRLLRSASADADQPSPIVVGNGGRGGIPYAVGRDVVVLAANGARVLAWRAPATVVALAENNGALAVGLATGDVIALSTATGKEVAHATYGAVVDVRAIASGFVVQTTAGIVLRRGGVVRDLDVPAGSRMIGFVDGWLAYVHGGQIRAYSWRKHEDVVLRIVGNGVVADYDANGLSWASGSTLCWSTSVYVFGPGYAKAARCSR